MYVVCMRHVSSILLLYLLDLQSVNIIYRQILKYWLKLTCTSDHRYIAIAFRESPPEWSLFVKRLLYENGFGKVWETNAAHISHPMFIQKFEQRLKDTFMQSCFSDMETSNNCFYIDNYVENSPWRVISIKYIYLQIEKQ